MNSAAHPNNYSLRAEIFKTHLCKGFSLLQQQQEFVDVTLATDGHFVKAHQNILALASPYLKELLQSASSQHPIIFLCNISYTALSYILEYVYTGEVNIPSEVYPSFINAAKQMHIKGLEHLSNFMEVSEVPNKFKENVQIESNNADIQDSHVLQNVSNETNIIGEGPSVNVPEPMIDNTVIDNDSYVDENNKNSDSHINDDEVTSNDVHYACGESNTASKSIPEDTPVIPLFTKSNRNSLMMILNRYVYNMHHQSDNGHKRRWRCIEYRRKHCLAYIDTVDEKIVARINHHSHEFHDKKIITKIGAKKKVFTSLKQAIK